eukprot:6009874-Alexandrium_andersonii.AAC.1
MQQHTSHSDLWSIGPPWPAILGEVLAQRALEAAPLAPCPKCQLGECATVGGWRAFPRRLAD